MGKERTTFLFMIMTVVILFLKLNGCLSMLTIMKMLNLFMLQK